MDYVSVNYDLYSFVGFGSRIRHEDLGLRGMCISCPCLNHSYRENICLPYNFEPLDEYAERVTEYW